MASGGYSGRRRSHSGVLKIKNKRDQTHDDDQLVVIVSFFRYSFPLLFAAAALLTGFRVRQQAIQVGHPQRED
jgi:hypothetical protein